MEDMARAEYPAMLAALQPGQAVQTLTERMKRMTRVNNEVADWLQVQQPTMTTSLRVVDIH
jgi:cystathionine beta-lyase/cystathionine gamma-synthase